MSAPDDMVAEAPRPKRDEVVERLERSSRLSENAPAVCLSSDLRDILARLAQAERERDAAIMRREAVERERDEALMSKEAAERRAEETERLAGERLAERDQAMFVADCIEAHALAKAAKLTWPDDVLNRVDEWINRKHGGDGTVTDIARALIACARNPGADGVITMLDADERRAAALTAAAEGTGGGDA